VSERSTTTISAEQIDRLVEHALAGREALLAHELDALLVNRGLVGRLVDLVDDDLYRSLAPILVAMVRTAREGAP
jgi:hypothetical protein